MSLREAYTLAHTAQCRLQLAASRPDRNLRFVVGHLMHYESLRLRIVEIEHEITKPSRSSAVTFQGTGQVDHRLQYKSSIGRRSPPPPTQTHDDEIDSDEEEDMAFDDEAEDGLSLERFPSASAQLPRPSPQPTRTEADPPELEPDEGDDSDDDEELHSPEDPSQEEMERAVKSPNNELYATYYEGVRKCVCHGKTDAPRIDKMWDLAPDPSSSSSSELQTTQKGVTITRAVAQISDDLPEAQSVCTSGPLDLEHPTPPQQVVA